MRTCEFDVNMAVHCPVLVPLHTSLFVTIRIEDGASEATGSAYCRIGEASPSIDYTNVDEKKKMYARCKGCRFLLGGFEKPLEPLK